MSTPPDTASAENVWSKIGLYVGVVGGIALGALQYGHWLAVAKMLIPSPLYTFLMVCSLGAVITSVIVRRSRRTDGYADGYADGLAAARASANGHGQLVQMPPRGSMRS